MRKSTRWRAAAIGAALLVVAAGAQADWLVLRDGSQLEIKGTWKVSGKQIVFTTVDGKLSSLRGDLVDLEASTKATEEAVREQVEAATAEEAEAEPEVKPKAKWSLTDKDFERPKSDEEESAGGDAKDTKPVAPAAPKSDLGVVVWSQSIDPGRNRIRVSGTLQNEGKDMASAVGLEIQLVDRQGVVVGAQSAVLQKQSLAPGESTDFSTTFPQIISYETVEFAPKATMLKITPKEKPADTPPN